MIAAFGHALFRFWPRSLARYKHFRIHTLERGYCPMDIWSYCQRAPFQPDRTMLIRAGSTVRIDRSSGPAVAAARSMSRSAASPTGSHQTGSCHPWPAPWDRPRPQAGRLWHRHDPPSQPSAAGSRHPRSAHWDQPRPQAARLWHRHGPPAQPSATRCCHSCSAHRDQPRPQAGRL